MVALLEPLVMAPDLEERIEVASSQAESPPLRDSLDSLGSLDLGGFARRRFDPVPSRTTPPTAVEQVAGVILGSPEFQRR